MSDRIWKKLIALDVLIDKIESSEQFCMMRSEYDKAVDDWIELAMKLDTDADGVKIKRGRPTATLHQRVLF